MNTERFKIVELNEIEHQSICGGDWVAYYAGKIYGTIANFSDMIDACGGSAGYSPLR
jgi:hypothetical protein